MTIYLYLKHLVLRVLSYFKSDFVKTGQSFSTLDETVCHGNCNDLLESSISTLSKKNTIVYPNPLIEFKTIGAAVVGGKYVYRLYCPDTKAVYDIDIDLYERIFLTTSEEENNVSN